MAFNLPKVLKALLFSSSQPLAIKDMQAAFTRFHEQAAAQAAAAADAAETAPASGDGEGSAPAAPAAEEPVEIIVEAPDDAELYHEVPALITAAQIREAMDAIAAEMRTRDDGLLLIEGANGYRLVTHPRFARWVRILRQEPPPLKLSQSAIETLAIIAYRQPSTRTEIETIRGVSAEAGINRLMERELVYIMGRADLPGRPIQYGTTDKFLEFIGIKSLDELPASDVLSSRQVDEWLQSAANPSKMSDADMGLAQENLPLEQGLLGGPAAEREAAVTAASEVPASVEAAEIAEAAPAERTGRSPAEPEWTAPADENKPA